MEVVEKNEVIRSSHDWAINKVEKILKARIWPKSWEIIEKNLSQSPGSDLKVKAPNGDIVVIESEVEHASTQNKWKGKANKIKQEGIKTIIILGEKKHGEMLKKELGGNFCIISWPVWRLAEGLLPI
ncbi:MAG: hypothetical protein U9O41_02250 [Candidatus Aerophobetes bacterium]|nr:hypothetical protein [Candidatus Aerophobetes bacterium]